MSISVSDFWKLAVRSRAVTLEEAKRLNASFARTPGAIRNANSRTVAEWLIASGVLSRYQARQLLANKPEPFLFGDYQVIDRVAQGPLAGLYRAMHVTSGQSAMLFFCESKGAAVEDWVAQQQQAEAELAAQYPQAGRIFGMVEAEQQRFLVLEDASDRIPVAPDPTSRGGERGGNVSQARATGQPGVRPISNRPIPVPRPEDSLFEVEKSRAIPHEGFLSIPDVPVTFAKKKSTSVLFLLYGGVACLALFGLAAFVLLGGLKKSEQEPEQAADLEGGRGELLPGFSLGPSKPFSSLEKVGPAEPEQSEPAIQSARQAKPVEPAKGVKPIQPALQTEKPVEPSPPAALEIADDGQTLWTSPTQGSPLDLRYLANGAQMFLVLRPSALLNTEEGAKVLAALGPRGEAAGEFVRTVAGINLLEDIERLLVAFYPVDDAPPQVAMVVTLREAASNEQLLQAWHNPKVVARPRKFYQGASWAYYLPTEADGRVFAVAPPNLMAEILSMEGPPSLRREMEKLLRDTDDSRHVTLLVAPTFLFGEGKAIFSGDAEKLKDPLLAYLGEGVQAAELSFHVSGENFFGEMRVYGSLENSPYKWAEMYRARLSELPALIEAYLAELNPQQYGRLILARMPRMIGELAAYTRIGDEHNHAVLRCYLPAAAAHNLTLAAELALSERPGGAAVVPTTGPKNPTTVAEALQQNITLSFPRNTLEKGLEMLGEEIGAPVHIEGKDLQLEGITKNQSFGLDERGKPADEILRKIMQLANPDGKLVYVIKPLEPGGKDVVFVTTRAAAARRGDHLPPQLELAPPKK